MDLFYSNFDNNDKLIKNKHTATSTFIDIGDLYESVQMRSTIKS